MKVYDERKSTAEEISRLLEKKSFDEVKLSPKVAAAVEKMFRLAQQVRRQVLVIRRFVRHNEDFTGAGQHVDIHMSVNRLLGQSHENVPGAGDLFHFGKWFPYQKPERQWPGPRPFCRFQ